MRHVDSVMLCADLTMLKSISIPDPTFFWVTVVFMFRPHFFLVVFVTVLGHLGLDWLSGPFCALILRGSAIRRHEGRCAQWPSARKMCVFRMCVHRICIGTYRMCCNQQDRFRQGSLILTTSDAAEIICCRSTSEKLDGSVTELLTVDGAAVRGTEQIRLPNICCAELCK